MVFFSFGLRAEQENTKIKNITKLSADALYVVNHNEIKLIAGRIRVRELGVTKVIVNKRSITVEGVAVIEKRETHFVVYSIKGESMVLSNDLKVKIPEGFTNWFSVLPPYQVGLIKPWKNPNQKIVSAERRSFASDVYKSVFEEKVALELKSQALQKQTRLREKKEKEYFNDLYLNNYMSK